MNINKIAIAAVKRNILMPFPLAATSGRRYIKSYGSGVVGAFAWLHADACAHISLHNLKCDIYFFTSCSVKVPHQINICPVKCHNKMPPKKLHWALNYKDLLFLLFHLFIFLYIFSAYWMPCVNNTKHHSYMPIQNMHMSTLLNGNSLSALNFDSAYK